MKSIVRMVCVVACFYGGLAFAQERSDGRAAAPAVAAVAVETKTPPPVPDDAKNLYAQLQVRRAGFADVMALLQKEIDSVDADRARLIQRLIAAQPDYDLAPVGTLAVAYVAKKDPTKGGAVPK